MKLKIRFVILIKKKKNDQNFSRQLKLKFLKYEIPKFAIHYTKGLAKERKQKKFEFRKRIKKKKIEISLHDAKNQVSIIVLKMDQTQFTITLQKALELEANTTGMTTAEVQQFFF